MTIHETESSSMTLSSHVLNICRVKVYKLPDESQQTVNVGTTVFVDNRFLAVLFQHEGYSQKVSEYILDNMLFMVEYMD